MPTTPKASTWDIAAQTAVQVNDKNVAIWDGSERLSTRVPMEVTWAGPTVIFKLANGQTFLAVIAETTGTSARPREEPAYTPPF